MVRRKDRPVLRVHVVRSDKNRPQHLLEAYARLVPMIWRTSQRPDGPPGRSSKVKEVMARSGGEQ